MSDVIPTDDQLLELMGAALSSSDEFELSDDMLDQMVSNLMASVGVKTSPRYKVIPSDQLEAYLALPLEVRIQVLEEGA